MDHGSDASHDDGGALRQALTAQSELNVRLSLHADDELAPGCDLCLASHTKKAMRYPLHRMPYEGKYPSRLGTVDPRLVARANSFEPGQRAIHLMASEAVE